QRGVTLVRGRARLAGERRVEVDGRTLSAKKAVVLATGSEAALPPIPGLAESRPWTNREATTSKRTPGSLIVLGGGVVGVELGQAWSTLGAQVTIVEALPRLIAREEPFASEQVHAALVERGIDVRVGVPAVEVVRNGAVTVRLESGDEVAGSDWLYAIGDVNGRALLTHMGEYQGRIAADAILGGTVQIDGAANGMLSP